VVTIQIMSHSEGGGCCIIKAVLWHLVGQTEQGPIGQDSWCSSQDSNWVPAK
jgi:hypothetical protein